PEATQRNLLEQPAADLLGNARDHFSFDEPRGDGVHRDALAGELLGQRLGERRHAGLGRGVVGLAEIPDLPDHRRHVHDAPVALLEHLVDEHLRAVERAVEVDGEHLTPGGVVHLHERLVGVDTGVVDQDVEVAELGQHVLGHTERIGIVADVGPGENRAASHLRDVLRDVDGSRFAGDVIDGNVGALLDESEEMIRNGKEISVVDAATGEDLTSVTLTQIILENERNHRSALPAAFLHQLVKHGEAWQDFIQRSMKSSLEGIVSSQREVERVFREWSTRSGWAPTPRTDAKREAEPAKRDAAEPDPDRLRDEVATLRERLRALEDRLEKRRAEPK